MLNSDIHRCGNCMIQFNSLKDFFLHKLSVEKCIVTFEDCELLPSLKIPIFLKHEDILPFHTSDEEVSPEEEVEIIETDDVIEEELVVDISPEDLKLEEPSTSPHITSAQEEDNMKLEETISSSPVQCDICKQVYKNSTILNVHKSTVHSDIKPYLCDVCSASFKTKGSLTIHQRRHTDEIINHSKMVNCVILKKGTVKHYKCQFCDTVFTRKNNCNRHEKGCTYNQSRPPSMFSCTNCKTSFLREDNLKKHMIRCTSDKTEFVKKTRTPCLVEGCDLKFLHKISLINHLNASHAEVVVKQPIIKTFQTFEEFLQWKELEEENTFSYFTQKNSLGKASTCRYYYCQHDGVAKKIVKKTNKSVVKGRIKVGNFCIAKMKVWEDSNKVICLEYFPTHSHRCTPEDFVHHPLPRSTSAYIDQQIAKDVSPSKIFEKVTKAYNRRNTITLRNFKLSILTKKRIQERARKRRMALDKLTDNTQQLNIETDK